jgi:multicomponent Na+:H+ antiporter subunit D
VIALVYVGRVLEVIWLQDPSLQALQASEAPPAMLLPIMVLAAATVFFGFDTAWTAGVAATVAETLLGGLR